MHEFGAYAPNITGFGATPRESAFLFVNFLNNVRVVRVKFCGLAEQDCRH